MELTRIFGNSYTADLDGTSVCFYMLNEEDAVLVDTGEIASSELLRFLKKARITPKAIINTHLHIDHVGNNQALCTSFDCPVFASQEEIDFKNHYQCCEEFEAWLKPNCRSGIQLIEGAAFGIIPTPGHSTGHQAVVTPDGVCCIGDAVMSMSKLRKSRIPYVWDVENAMKSMRLLRDTDYDYYLAAHNGIISGREIKATINANIQKEEKLQFIVKSIVKGGIAVNSLETEMMKAAGVRNPETMSFEWMRYSARARILELVRQGKLKSTAGKETVFPAGGGSQTAGGR